MSSNVLGRRVAALIGLLSVGAALTVGHLAAGLVGPSASPFVAVGNSAVDRTPHVVKDFAIRTFGSNDKLVLFAGMAVVIALVAAVAGVVSRRRRLPGVIVIALLGAVGIVAVLDRPDLGVLAVLVPIAALITGVWVFRWLHGLGLAAAGPTPAAEDAAPERIPNPNAPRAGRERTAAPNAPHMSPTRTTQPAETHHTPSPDAPHMGPTRTTQGTETHHTPDRNAPHAEVGGDAGARRRGFLVGVGVTAVGGALAAGGGALLGTRVDVQASRQAVGGVTPDTPAPPVPEGVDFVTDGTPAFLTSNRDFYRVDTALVVPRIRAQEWKLRVHGMVDRELRIGFDELREWPLVENAITLTCVSNEVGGPYVSTAKFVGVPLRDVLTRAGVRPGADQLVSRSADGWTAGTPTGIVLEPDRGALLAIGMNGEPLPVEHGFPVRMVVPGLYGYVSATKWLVELELTTFGAFDPYWARRGWAKLAPIKTMSRIDKPREFERLSPTASGQVVVAGVAWAQHRGVDAVEVRIDGGSWQRARLAAEFNLDTWRMWRTEFTLRPGQHTAEARATDRTGYVQTGERANPVPDGATGWHSVPFTVS